MFPDTVRNHQEHTARASDVAKWILNGGIERPYLENSITIKSGDIEMPVQFFTDPEFTVTVCKAINTSLKHRSLPPVATQRLTALDATASLLNEAQLTISAKSE